MKFKKLLLLGAGLMLVFSLTACGNAKDSTASAAGTDQDKDITLGVCAGPYGDMFKDAIQPSLEKKGYKVTVTEFSDYVQPDKALANNEIDLNMFQHSVYLEKFSKDNQLKLTAITEIPTVGMGVYSNTVKSFDELKDGAIVTLPDDPTNLTRALKVLQAAGLVKIDPNVDIAVATEKDISENPKNLVFKLIEAPQLPRTLDSADLAVVNGNYAIAAGLKPSDAIYNETLGAGYVNVIAVRTEDVDSQLSKDILEVVKSSEFKSVIEDPNGQYSSFQKPANY